MALSTISRITSNQLALKEEAANAASSATKTSFLSMAIDFILLRLVRLGLAIPNIAGLIKGGNKVIGNSY